MLRELTFMFAIGIILLFITTFPHPNISRYYARLDLKVICQVASFNLDMISTAS
jgi:hypothetical protein